MVGVKPKETKRCPPEFQERITRMFGKNMFGEPNFRIVWGQTATIRMGNVWRDRKGNERKGYQERLVQFGMPCWVIQRWRSPKEYGTPALYYMETYDAATGLYQTGEYPWKGRYETLQPLYRREFVDGKMVLEHFPISHLLIDRVIPLIIKAQSMSYWEKKAAQDLAIAAEEKAKVKEIADRLEESLPTWMGPVSFSNQGCRTSKLDKKMEEIQKFWNRIAAEKRNWKKGFFQGSTLTK